MEEKVYQFQKLLQNDLMKGTVYSIDYLEKNVLIDPKEAFEEFSHQYEATFKTSFFQSIRKLSMEQYFVMCRMLKKYGFLTPDP